jgi:MFS family permease
MASTVLLLTAALPLALLYTPAGPDETRTLRPQTREPIPAGPLAGLVAAMTLMGAIFGVLQTSVTAYATQTGDRGQAGMLYALLGIASAVAGLACELIPPRVHPRTRYLLFTTGLLLGMTTLAASGVLLPLPLAIPVAGLTIAPNMISVYALTENLAPNRVTTTMTIVCTAGPVGTAIGPVSAGLLAGADNHRPPLYARPLPGSRSSSPSPRPEPHAAG